MIKTAKEYFEDFCIPELMKHDKFNSIQEAKAYWDKSYLEEPQVVDPIISAINKAMEDSSIAFAEWLSGYGYTTYDEKSRWISQEESGNKVFTTKQLYEKFIKP